eukprot:11187723-Lingulodinium_polyedra.AAC.1
MPRAVVLCGWPAKVRRGTVRERHPSSPRPPGRKVPNWGQGLRSPAGQGAPFRTKTECARTESAAGQCQASDRP